MKWITADNLDAWGRTTASEVLLPELIADLISATAPEITSIRFPSGGKGRVRGFDGVLTSIGGLLNVPQGRSVWEFGTSADYQGKAMRDFNSRTGDVSAEEQKDLTLVLVTPFTWDSSNIENKIEDWEKAREKASSWKNVVLIDGAKLEKWLDTAPAVAAKHARQTLKTAPVQGVRSTDEFWSDFSSRFKPSLIEKVLTAEREAAAEQLLAQLMGPPQEIKLIGDALDFVTAFAVAAIRSAHPEAKEFLEARTLIVDTPEAGREVVGKSNLVFLLRGEAARAPAPFAESGPTLVPLARWQRVTDGTLLPRQSNFAITRALVEMHIEEAEADTLARGSGGNLAALERSIPGGACENPPWINSARLLVPAILAGGWDSANALDKEILALLAGTDGYAAYEREIRGFVHQADAPLEREDTVFKIRAPLDAFIHAGDQIGEDHLELLGPVMEKVFGQLDPDPDPDQPIYMRERSPRHSDWLRDGLATTLVAIAAWQSQARLAIPAGAGQTFANSIVESLPGLGTDPRILTSLKSELPLLAEAAPQPFLSALERMLEGNGEAIRPIFDEIEGFAFPTSQHTGVLWALETLAWDPRWFRRACLILARLAEIDPGGKLVNRPANSLVDILLLWKPSTLATPEARLAMLDEILARHADIGWNLVLRLLPGATTSTSGTSRLRLRGAEAPPTPPLTNVGLWKAQRAVIERAILFGAGSANRMRDLLAPMLRFPDVERSAALGAFEATLADTTGEERELLWSALNEQLRRHRRFAGADWALSAADLAEAERIVTDYSPNDPILAAAELFDQWALDADGDAQAKARADVVAGLARDHGGQAVLGLVQSARMSHFVLRAIDDAGLPPELLAEMIRDATATGESRSSASPLLEIYRKIVGTMHAANFAKSLYRPSQNEDVIAGLFYAWPSTADTWNAVATIGDPVIEAFWQNYPSFWTEGTRHELLHILLALLRRGRAIAALESVLNRLGEVPTCLLLNILDSTVTELNSGQNSGRGSLLDYDLEQMFKALDTRGIADIDIGQREYALLPVLGHHERQLKLHRLLASDPEMFHQIVRDIYRGESEADTESKPTNAERARWRQAYKLLSDLSLTPGFLDEQPNADALRSWVDRVRALGQMHDRAEVTEIVIGNVLAHAPEDITDGGWPHRLIRDEIERSPSGGLMQGLRTEKFNMRGVTVRGMLDGGQKERDLANDYRRYAATAQRWPRTAELLTTIAESWDQDADREDIEARQRALRR